MRAFFYGSCPFSSFKPPKPISKKQKEKPHHKQTPIHPPFTAFLPPTCNCLSSVNTRGVFDIPP